MFVILLAVATQARATEAFTEQPVKAQDYTGVLVSKLVDKLLGPCRTDLEDAILGKEPCHLQNPKTFAFPLRAHALGLMFNALPAKSN